jgi:hypothetical protein
MTADREQQSGRKLWSSLTSYYIQPTISVAHYRRSAMLLSQEYLLDIEAELRHQVEIKPTKEGYGLLADFLEDAQKYEESEECRKIAAATWYGHKDGFMDDTFYIVILDKKCWFIYKEGRKRMVIDCHDWKDFCERWVKEGKYYKF